MYVCFHLSIVYITLYINADFEFVQKKQQQKTSLETPEILKTMNLLL